MGGGRVAQGEDMGFAEMAICVEHVGILKPTAKFTLAMLADRADPFMDAEKTRRRTDGRVECWPSVADLMHRTNQSKSTVLRQLKQLEHAGIISVEKRWRRDRQGRARQTSNRYVLNLPEILEGRFRDGDQALGVKMTPKESYPQSAGQDKSVKLTPKEPLGVKNDVSLGVNGDTPINDQELTTNPSLHPSRDESGDVGAAAPRGAAPSGAAGEDSPKVDSHGLDGAVSDSNAKDVITPMEGEKTAQMATQSRTEGSVVSSEDRQLLADSLPEPMQAIPPRDCARVAADIRERLEAGWSCATVRAALAARALPVQVKTLTGLVRARLRSDVPVDTPPISATSTRPQVLRTSAGDVVARRDVDAGMMTIAYRQALANGECPEEMGKWEWAQAVGIENFL